MDIKISAREIFYYFFHGKINTLTPEILSYNTVKAKGKDYYLCIEFSRGINYFDSSEIFGVTFLLYDSDLKKTHRLILLDRAFFNRQKAEKYIKRISDVFQNEELFTLNKIEEKLREVI